MKYITIFISDDPEKWKQLKGEKTWAKCMEFKDDDLVFEDEKKFLTVLKHLGKSKFKC